LIHLHRRLGNHGHVYDYGVALFHSKPFENPCKIGNQVPQLPVGELFNGIGKEYHKELRETPELKIKELEGILKERGFKDEIITQLVSKITPDTEAWEKLMLSESFGEYGNIDPKRTSLATFIAFVVAGFIPLLAFVLAYSLDLFKEYAPLISVISTGMALFFVGTLKASIVNKKPLRSGVETLLIGGIAASVAFFIGFILKGFVS